MTLACVYSLMVCGIDDEYVSISMTNILTLTSGVISSGLMPVPPVVNIKCGRNSSLNFSNVS
jgi:hypothetical protein